MSGRYRRKGAEPSLITLCKEMKIHPIAIGIVITLSGCSRPDVVGTWQSDPHESELGLVVETIVFRPDGTCQYTLADAESPEDQMVSTNNWHRSGSLIKIETKPTEYIALSQSDSSTLTLQDPKHVIQFRKQ